MFRPLRWLLLLLCAAAAFAQNASAPPEAKLVLGIDAMKNGVKGTLETKDGMFRFSPSNGVVAQIPVSSIEDVSVGSDSKRTFSGVGQVTMLAPYGGGRFFSLFRDKLDVLTVSFRDENGGLHGVIFTTSPGGAKPVKAALLAAGAKSSTPLDSPQPSDAKSSTDQKMQPAAEKKGDK